MKREIKGIRAKGCVEKWFSPLWWFPSWPFRNNRRFQTVPRGTEMDLLLEAWKGEGFGFERKERRDGFDRKLYKAVSRAILYFIFERHADWTRTLTALVVMLYNALSLVRPSLSVDNTREKGATASHASDFSRYKIWRWCSKGWI